MGSTLNRWTGHRLRSEIRKCCALVLSIAPMAATAAERAGVVTRSRGPAAVVRGATRVNAPRRAFGSGPATFLRSARKASLRSSFPTKWRSRSDRARAAGRRIRAWQYRHGRLLRGARSAEALRVKQGATLRFVTPLFTLAPLEGSVVFVPGAAAGSVFVESGEARVTEPPAKGAPMQIKSGQFYVRKADQKGAIAPRPSPEFVAALPNFFLDPLPSRVARYKDHEVQPKRVEDVSYADVQQWLQAPPDIRRPLMQRFRPRISDPAFRAGLVTNLKLHPEWDPILFPEKYQPKGPDKGAPARAAPGGTP